jgi:hypothetical protein
MLKLLHEVGRSVAVLHENALLFVYRYGAGWPKPHFHPLYAPHSSRVLTLHAPHDWVHHRGLMWSFGRVAPQDAPDQWVDFWEERVCERDEDGRKIWPCVLPKERRGIIRHTGFRILEPGREFAILCADQEWRPATDFEADEINTHPLLHAVQTVKVYPSRAEGWLFDMQWEMSAPGKPVVLSQAPQDSDYKDTPYGLGCQFSREMAGGVLLNSNSCRNESCVLEPASWCDYSSPIDDDETGESRWIGMTLMDHPSNPRHPSPFFAIRQHVAFLSASPVAHEPLVITSEPQTFRYRVWVHDGRGEKEKLDTLFAEFADSRS